MSSKVVFGLIKTNIDAHTLGISLIANILRECGYSVVISPDYISEAVTFISKVNNFSILQKWITENHITRLGFSYRLDPVEATSFFCKLNNQLHQHKMFQEEGGILTDIFFAGLPDACVMVQREVGDSILVFPGDETPEESLIKLGVPKEKFPKSFSYLSEYDKMRFDFAKCLIESETYKSLEIPDHLGYSEAGNLNNSYIARMEYCRKRKTLPIIRAHVGPYNPKSSDAIIEFVSWVKRLSQGGLLDVLSIGSSQLTQSNFGENWDGLPNGGGVPINSEFEYSLIKEASKQMLVRTYAGTKNIPYLAKIHEKTLNISWHALSFWWFCEIDGRGNNTVLENLNEHIETIKYIASTGKPLEPNVSHHFSFRGSDDISYIISAFLAAKTAKKFGIKHLIVQNMLNTPKHTTGIQDLAKGAVLLKLIREMEDSTFKVSLQARAGLDYFSPDIDKAKVQLAAVTTLMDDLEPDNFDSPEIIHVVSFSEAIRLATPDVIEESIQITRTALTEYRELKRKGKTMNLSSNRELRDRIDTLYDEAKESITILENYIPFLYTAKGLFKVFELGFFPLPYLMNCRDKYPNVTKYNTGLKNGGVFVIDDISGEIISTPKRYKEIISKNE